MDKKKHTPGPWRWTAVEGGWDGVESNDGLICKLALNEPENARLIAAAPELLVALKEMQVRSHQAHSHGEFPARTCGLCTRSLAAIAKAEGKP